MDMHTYWVDETKRNEKKNKKKKKFSRNDVRKNCRVVSIKTSWRRRRKKEKKEKWIVNNMSQGDQ